ncbi:IucA/IucC family protein [Planomonospora algeriensis]
MTALALDSVLDSPAAVAEEATLAALLRCAVREVAGPRGLVRHDGAHLLLHVAGVPLRVRAHGGIALRLTGPAEWHRGRSMAPALRRPARPAAGGRAGRGQRGVRRPGAVEPPGRGGAAGRRRDAVPPADPWLASEQALVFGHPFHPSPKARGGVSGGPEGDGTHHADASHQGGTRDGASGGTPGADWLAYAPEAHASFPLRLLGVRHDVLAEAGETAALDALGDAPPGYALLPAHPWQLDLLAAELAAPLADGRLVDLGRASRGAVPTSSVRTVYEPSIERCLKFSLDVRITNCVRKNSWYELAGAVELTARLEPVFRDLAERFPGTRWLPEPGYRSADLGTRLLEGLSVIVRASPRQVCGPGVTPLLSGALAAGPLPGSAPVLPESAAADPVRWWRAYVECVAPPVLEAYLAHGVVLEPHLQNVLVGVDPAGTPVEAVFRDLEGTKLVAGRHDLSALPHRVAEALTYDAADGWNRVVYCLVVNHLAEVAAALAGDGPVRELWAAAGEVLARYAAARGVAAAPGGPAVGRAAAGQGQPDGPVVAGGGPRGRVRRGGQPAGARGGCPVIPAEPPAYVYDLRELDAHVAEVRAALDGIELHYAVKANPDPELLRVLARYVDGFEVASGGELAHVRALFPDVPVALGGPGKTDAELAAAVHPRVAPPVHRLHVESPGELRRLLALGRPADVLLRVNLDLPVEGASLAMGGGATPFGMDPGGVAECLALLRGQDLLRWRGVHAHLASGLDAPRMLGLAEAVLDYARGIGAAEVNLGGGMGVSYADPHTRFDWKAYGAGLAGLRRPGEVLRVEPGRSLTVYCGRYVTRVIDVKRVHGELFAVVAGGTHHLRTPATKGHDQPLAGWTSAGGPGGPGEPVTIVGQLCTPKDVLARRVPVRLEPGDVVEFAMAGAYAWNISHHDFLMHPRPGFHYLRPVGLENSSPCVDGTGTVGDGM